LTVLTCVRALAFLLSTADITIANMSSRFKRLIALWFVVQIVLPFTAPLQTCDLVDLLGHRAHRSAPASPESSSMPTTSETEANANAFVSPIEPSALRVSAGVITLHELAAGPVLATSRLSPAPQVQRSILRL
jgi:hypothetical protein